MSCCENQKEIKIGNVFVCENCDALLDDLEFETTLFSTDSRNNIRYNKFLKLVLMTDNLSWSVRQSMLDLFPKIEYYFQTSKRINFINMYQLCREMCRVLGYDEYIEIFPALKTKARVKQVSKFVDDAVNSFQSGASLDPDVSMCRLEDLTLLELSCKYINMSKVPNETHIYSNIKRNNISVL
jgi:hypothetical protein